MKEEQAGLIAACIQGDETAITQFVQEHQLGLFRLALSVLNDTAEANEATQDAFVAALKALRSYKENAPFKSWLYTITLNISRSRLRKLKAQERLQRTLGSIFRVRSQNSLTLEQTVIHNEEDAILWSALEKLGEKHRIPLVLRYYHDFPVAEIAEVMKIKEGTVHSRLSIGREKLRAILDNSHKAHGE